MGVPPSLFLPLFGESFVFVGIHALDGIRHMCAHPLVHQHIVLLAQALEDHLVGNDAADARCREFLWMTRPTVATPQPASLAMSAMVTAT